VRKSQVKLGEIYYAKVSEKLARVRIDRVHPSGGWAATNISTGRKVRIRTAGRLRGVAPMSAQERV
jgi:hypothetical protein